MKKPQTRPKIPPRRSDNEKRELHPAPDAEFLDQLSRTVRYGGYAKHKGNPTAFGLMPLQRPRGDETLCDEHAGFTADRQGSIPEILRRGIRAGLVGPANNGEPPRIFWTVGDDGWIFECQITNAGLTEYHGYPVRPNEAIVERVFERFARWAMTNGESRDQEAAEKCRALYGIKP
jgi:hypothetical protein